MCRKVNCSNCSKPTWTGCGRHIESAIGGIPEEARCASWRGGLGSCKGEVAPPTAGAAQAVKSAGAKAGGKPSCAVQ